MDNICTGTEQTNWDLDASEQLEIDGANTSFTLTADRLVKIEVQLGSAGNLLHANGGILAVFVKLTPIDTSDKCVMVQKQMRLTATDTLALISLDPFWAKSGSVIEVHAKSTNNGDTSVGGIVWIYDIAPATTIAIVTALMADTGFTEGGSMTYEKLLKLLAGWIAGDWKDKTGDADTKQLLDADDGATAILEMALSETTPQRTMTIL